MPRTALVALVAASLLAGGCAADDGPGAPVAASAPPAATAPARGTACATAATMPLRAALAQTLMVGVASPTRAQLRTLLAGPTVGGLFLPGDGTRVLTDGRMRRARTAGKEGPRPLIATDDEGGRVQRLRALEGNLPSARKQARTMTPAEVQRLAERRGKALLRYGITMDLAPAVDVSDQRASAVIGDRSYGTNAADVLRYAGAFAAGLRAAGVLPTLKHFPGHGRAVGDSHRGRAVTPAAEELRTLDWAPYRALATTDVAVMMGHLIAPGLSRAGLPASLDPALYRVLREEIGFNGLVITDELAGMRAVRDRFGLAEAVRRALAAGADLALFNAAPRVVPGLLSKLRADVRDGRLPESRVREAAARVLAAKGCPGG